MNLTGDESLEARLIDAVRVAGHIVESIHERFAGISDDEVLALSVANMAPVITNDRDFGELVFRRRLPCIGLIYLRFPRVGTLEKAETLVRWMGENPSLVLGHYVVLGPTGARVRPLEAWPPA